MLEIHIPNTYLWTWFIDLKICCGFLKKCCNKTRMLKLMNKKNNKDFTLNNMFITSIDMHLLNIGKQLYRPWSHATSIAFDQCTHCWQQLMHKTFITQTLNLGEGMDSGAIVAWF